MLDVADDVEYNRNVGNEIGAWLSLVERCVRDAKAAGSNPVIPTNKKAAETVGFSIVPAVFTLI